MWLFSYIPVSVLDGVFIFIAIQSLFNNQMIERMTLIIKDRAAYPPYHYLRRVPIKVVHLFTICQILQLLVLSCVAFLTSTLVELVFPIVVMGLLPMRVIVLPRFFHQYHLDYLDRHGSQLKVT